MSSHPVCDLRQLEHTAVDKECTALQALFRKGSPWVIPISLARLAAHTSATAIMSHMICPAVVLLNEGTQ